MIRLDRRTRLPRLPVPFAAGLVILGGLVVMIEFLATRFSSAPWIESTCRLRAVTGYPCATCGSTRAVYAFFNGDVLSAFAYNPLVVTAGLLTMLILGLRLATGRQVILTLSGRGWTVAALGLVAAVAVNWWYVWQYHTTA